MVEAKMIQVAARMIKMTMGKVVEEMKWVEKGS